MSVCAKSITFHTRSTQKLVDHGIEKKVIHGKVTNLTKLLTDMERYHELNLNPSNVNITSIRSIVHTLQKRYWKLFTVLVEDSQIIVIRQR